MSEHGIVVRFSFRWCAFWMASLVYGVVFHDIGFFSGVSVGMGFAWLVLYADAWHAEFKE